MALFGVLMANLVLAFRVSATVWYLPLDPAVPFVDRAVEILVQFLIQGKAIALFSILFGVGLAMQHDRFSRLGDPEAWLSRRMLVLLGFGLAHLLLLWNGDILTEYALAALAVIPLLSRPARTLALGAAAMYVLYLVFPLLTFMPPWPDAATLKTEYAETMRTYGSGGYWDIRRYAVHEWLVFAPIYLSLFPLTLAYFLFGAALWRSGLLAAPRDHLRGLRIAAVAGLVGGAFLSATGGGNVGGPAPWPAVELLFGSTAATVMAIGYGALLLAMLQSPTLRWLLRAFAAPGRMAFTNYIVQSLVFGWIFFGYGLGLIGQVSALRSVVWGLAMFAAQAMASALWLRFFRFGPLEWLWRSLTYGERQPMRRATN